MILIQNDNVFQSHQRFFGNIWNWHSSSNTGLWNGNLCNHDDGWNGNSKSLPKSDMTLLNCDLIISICFLKSHDTINEMILWKAVFYGFWVCALMLLVCEVGQRLSEKFTEINDVMDQLNWYAYPREVKRMLPTILTNLQQPVIIKCFAFIFCDREYSKRVSLSSIPSRKWIICSINSFKLTWNIPTDLRHRIQILHGSARNGKLSAIHRFCIAWLVMSLEQTQNCTCLKHDFIHEQFSLF